MAARECSSGDAFGGFALEVRRWEAEFVLLVEEVTA